MASCKAATFSVLRHLLRGITLVAVVVTAQVTATSAGPLSQSPSDTNPSVLQRVHDPTAQMHHWDQTGGYGPASDTSSHPGLDIFDYTVRPPSPATGSNCPTVPESKISIRVGPDIITTELRWGDWRRDAGKLIDQDRVCDDYRGAEVRAALPGWIEWADVKAIPHPNSPLTSFPHIVVIDHGRELDGSTSPQSLQTEYWHLGSKQRLAIHYPGLNPPADYERAVTVGSAYFSFIQVRANECVRAGDLIGYQGYSGRTEGTHLHFRAKRNASEIRTLSWFQGTSRPELRLEPPPQCAPHISSSDVSFRQSNDNRQSGILEAAGGIPPYTWSVGTLPSGLSVDASGVISGIPTQEGTFIVPVEITDDAGWKARRDVVVKVRRVCSGQCNSNGG